jgi:hypothetical protein
MTSPVLVPTICALLEGDTCWVGNSMKIRPSLQWGSRHGLFYEQAMNTKERTIRRCLSLRASDLIDAHFQGNSVRMY